MRRSKLIKLLAPAIALAVVAAACGSDKKSTSTNAPGTTAGSATTAGGSATTAGGSATTAAGAATTAGSATTAGGSPTTAAGAVGNLPPAGSGSKDKGAFKLGVINSNALFGDYADGIKAAVDYVNAELNGLDGRQIDLQVCSIEYGVPDDTQRCANELAAAQVDFAVSTLNQFGTHMQILRGAGIPVLVGTAVSVPDYTTEGVYAISPAGGCAGTLSAMAKYAVQELKAKNIAVPYADIPSGVLCYADSEQKPLDVLKGTVAGATSPDAGSVPDLQRTGIPVPATNPDLAAVANQILAIKPDAILFSGPATTCFPLLAAMNSVGYSVAKTPFVMSTSCFDLTSAKAAGDNAKGLYFVGSGGYLTRAPADLQGQRAADAALYQDKGAKYGMKPEVLTRNFAQQGFTLVMSMAQRSAEVAAKGDKVDGKSLAAAFAATKDAPQFGSSPISCSVAPKPYISVCNGNNNVTKWDGTQLQPVVSDYFAMDLAAGTQIRTAPVG